jgi:hypothetical protein
MKQTAVEWLVKELNLEGYDHTVEQAKSMEREQMNEIHIDGIEQGYNMRYEQEKKMKHDTNNP